MQPSQKDLWLHHSTQRIMLSLRPPSAEGSSAAWQRLPRLQQASVAVCCCCRMALKAHHMGCRRESVPCCSKGVQGSGFFCCCLDRWCSGLSSPHAGEGARSKWRELLFWVASCLQQSPALIALTALQTGPSQLQHRGVGVLSGHAALACCMCFGSLASPNDSVFCESEGFLLLTKRLDGLRQL